jgi:BirA family transcriptional regulator, biotin operon repressor / biotin---[acetyl-CoA-carboxylase] ligase
MEAHDAVGALIAFTIRRHDSIGSTNDEAMRLARCDAAHGTVVCAAMQTAGRGRQGRHWHSPPGNLYVSIVLRPDRPMERVAELSFVAALAVADAADGALPEGVRATLKWPNDVLIRDAKVAGILIEHADPAAVVGIGMNVLHAPPDVPYAVTTLAASGARATDPDAVLPVLLAAFQRRFADWHQTGFAAVRTAWLQRAPALGSPLQIRIGDRTVQGRFAGLSHDGALVIETADGLRCFHAGEVLSPPDR